MSRPHTAPIHRLVKKIEVGHGCWRWLGGYYDNGYSQFMLYPGIKTTGHRAAYILLRGPIPTGLETDHLCRNRWCVNPYHLELTTHRENVRRSPLLADPLVARKERAKTHCPRGHAYDEENTRRYKGSRQCRACNLARMRRRLAARV